MPDHAFGSRADRQWGHPALIEQHADHCAGSSPAGGGKYHGSLHGDEYSDQSGSTGCPDRQLRGVIRTNHAVSVRPEAHGAGLSGDTAIRLAAGLPGEPELRTGRCRSPHQFVGDRIPGHGAVFGPHSGRAGFGQFSGEHKLRQLQSIGNLECRFERRRGAGQRNADSGSAGTYTSRTANGGSGTNGVVHRYGDGSGRTCLHPFGGEPASEFQL